MKILMLFPRSFDNPVVHRQIETLERFEHDVILVKGDYRLKKFYKLPILFLRALWHIRKCDVIHAHDLNTMGTGLILSVLFRKQLIYDLHDMYWFNRQDGKFKAMLKWLEQYFVTHSDVVLVPSAMIKDYYRRYNKNIVCILNVPDIEFVHDAKPKVKIQDDILRIGYFGTVRWTEELVNLLNAINYMIDVEIIIGGWGADKLINYRNSKVQILGECSLYDVANRYASVDIIYCVHPSKDQCQRFSVPMKVFDAMGFGLPVIVNKSGNTGKFVEQHNIGLGINPDDTTALITAIDMLKDKRLRLSFSRSGRRYFLKRFNWNLEQNKLLNVYDTLEMMR